MPILDKKSTTTTSSSSSNKFFILFIATILVSKLIFLKCEEISKEKFDYSEHHLTTSESAATHLSSHVHTTTCTSDEHGYFNHLESGQAGGDGDGDADGDSSDSSGGSDEDLLKNRFSHYGRDMTVGANQNTTTRFPSKPTTFSNGFNWLTPITNRSCKNYDAENYSKIEIKVNILKLIEFFQMNPDCEFTLPNSHTTSSNSNCNGFKSISLNSSFEFRLANATAPTGGDYRNFTFLDADMDSTLELFEEVMNPDGDLFLFLWRPDYPSVAQLPFGCNLDDTNLLISKSCMDLLSSNEALVLLQLFNESDARFYPTSNDESMNYYLEQNDLTEKFVDENYFCTNSTFLIEIENVTDYLIMPVEDFNRQSGSRFESYAGRQANITLYRDGLSLDDFGKIHFPFSIQIDPQMVEIENNFKSDINNSYVTASFCTKKKSIRIFSQSISYTIPYKTKILNVINQNTTSLRVDWQNSGVAHNFTLVCEHDQQRIANNYESDANQGYCESQVSLAGTKINVYIEEFGYCFRFMSSDIQEIIIEPEPVSNLMVTSINSDEIYFTWTPPNGQYDYILCQCILNGSINNNHVVVQNVIFNNQTFSQCSQLDLNYSYYINLTTIRIIDNKNYSNSIYSVFVPEMECKNLSCRNLEDYLQIDFDKLSDPELIMIMHRLSMLVNFSSGLYEMSNLEKAYDNLIVNIGSISNILKLISNRNRTEETENVVLGFMALSDQILNQSMIVLAAAQNLYNSSNNMVFGIETILKKLITEEQVFMTEFNNFKIKSILLDQVHQDVVDSYGMTSTTSNSSRRSLDPFNNVYNDVDLKYAAFYNPVSINLLIQQGLLPRMNFVAFANGKFFKAKDVDVYTGTNVVDCDSKKKISQNVLSLTCNQYMPDQDDLVITIFADDMFEQNCNTINRNLTFSCVFWDETLNDWNNDGCDYKFEYRNNKKYHICNCNHTTNFALLMVVDNFPFCDWCDTVLFYVSLVGIILSIIGLIVTILYDLCITFLPETKLELARKSSKFSTIMEKYASMSKHYLKIITTWCFTLLVLDCVYIAFSFFSFGESTSENLPNDKRISCIAIGVLLHYFLLSSFCFSMTITVIQYFIFYKSFKIFKFIYLKSALFSFGIPLIIVAIVLIVTPDAYINPNKYCWLQSTYAILAAILPIGVILIVNLIFFLLIVINHTRLVRNREKYFQTATSDQKGVKREVILILICFVNTGLTWLFGLLVTIPGNDSWIYLKFVYALVFCILNSTQGFHIFVVYILVSKRRQEILRHKLIAQIKILKNRLANM